MSWLNKYSLSPVHIESHLQIMFTQKNPPFIDKRTQCFQVCHYNFFSITIQQYYLTNNLLILSMNF